MIAITGSCLLLLLLASICACSSIGTTGKGVHNFGIVGGTVVNITEAPFMALFRPKGKDWWCGASIVSEQFLVSAAHCVGKDMRITVGTDNAQQGGEDYEIEKTIVHPKFVLDQEAIDYDICVIKLKKKLSFNDRVKPIKIADSSLVPKDGDEMVNFGFGATENYYASVELRKVSLPFVSLERCRKNYEQATWNVTDQMICAGGEPGKGGCNGDSGGPLVYKGYLIGCDSWTGMPCASKNLPTVFSYYASMLDFINESIESNSYFFK